MFGKQVKGLPFGGGESGLGSQLFPWGAPSVESNTIAPWENLIVFSCLDFTIRAFNEGPIGRKKMKPDGTDEWLEKDPLIELLNKPNEVWSGRQLMAATIVSERLDGNGYWFVERSAMRKPLALQYLPHWSVVPRFPANGSEYISYYEYNANGQQFRLDPRDVIHFRHGVDPLNTRLGLSRLKAMWRMVGLDNAATIFSKAIFQNFGMIGAILSPKDGMTLQADQQEKLKALWRQMRGAGAGDVIVPSAPVDLQFPDSGPDKLAVTETFQTTVDRIAGAFGYDPMVINLPSKSKTYSNMNEARQAAYESGIIPMYLEYADTLDRMLGQEFPADAVLSFDTRNIRVLQDDVDALYKRANEGFASGVLKRSDARRILSLDVGPEDEVYSDETSAAVTLAKQGLTQSILANSRKRRLEAELSDPHGND